MRARTIAFAFAPLGLAFAPSLVLASLSLALGCSAAGAPTTDAHGNTSAPPFVEVPAKGKTPDELLQARLEQAVRDLPKVQAMRGQNGLLVWPLALPEEPTDPMPEVRLGASTIAGRISAEVVHRIVRQQFGAFRACYGHVLAVTPTAAGRLTTTFTIGAEGSVTQAGTGGDAAAALPRTFTACINEVFSSLSFPAPRGPRRSPTCSSSRHRGRQETTQRAKTRSLRRRRRNSRLPVRAGRGPSCRSMARP